MPPDSDQPVLELREDEPGEYRVDDPAVRVEDLSISFTTTRERNGGLRRALLQMRDTSKVGRKVEALKGVSFEVQRGSVYGVIGRNGAGKSTLFRALGGILPPDGGRIELYGRVTPLLSLGFGFNRELPGRENILLGGLSSGLDQDHIDGHYEEIIEFADLGQAIDSPMRTYSSGMFGRLAFAIAAHLDPEILLVDEALSAGDARFKERTLEKITELCGGDTTVMIVSHGMGIIKQLADRALWLEEGEVHEEGPATDVVINYLLEDGLEEEASSYVDV